MNTLRCLVFIIGLFILPIGLFAGCLGRSLDPVIKTGPGKSVRIRTWFSYDNNDLQSNEPLSFSIDVHPYWKVLQKPSDIPDSSFKSVATFFIFIPHGFPKGFYEVKCSLYKGTKKIADVFSKIEVDSLVAVEHRIADIPAYFDPEEGMSFKFLIKNIGNLSKKLLVIAREGSVKQEVYFSPAMIELDPREEQEIDCKVRIKQDIRYPKTYVINLIVKDRESGTEIYSFNASSLIVPGKRSAFLYKDNVIPSVITANISADNVSGLSSTFNISGSGPLNSHAKIKYSLQTLLSSDWIVDRSCLQNYNVNLSVDEYSIVAGRDNMLGQYFQLLSAFGNGYLAQWKSQSGIVASLSTWEDSADYTRWLSSTFSKSFRDYSLSLCVLDHLPTVKKPGVTVIDGAFKFIFRGIQVETEASTDISNTLNDGLSWRGSFNCGYEPGIVTYGVISSIGQNAFFGSQGVFSSEYGVSYSRSGSSISSSISYINNTRPVPYDNESSVSGNLSVFSSHIYNRSVTISKSIPSSGLSSSLAVFNVQKENRNVGQHPKLSMYSVKANVSKSITGSGSLSLCGESLFYSDGDIDISEWPLANLSIAFDRKSSDSSGALSFGCKIGYKTSEIPPYKRCEYMMSYSTKINSFSVGTVCSYVWSPMLMRYLLDMSFEVTSPVDWYPHNLSISGSFGQTMLSPKWTGKISWTRPIGIVYKWSNLCQITGRVRDSRDKKSVPGQRFIIGLGPYKTLSDSDGCFCFRGVLSGDYSIGVENGGSGWVDSRQLPKRISLPKRSNIFEYLEVSPPGKIKGYVGLFSRSESLMQSVVKGMQQESSYVPAGGINGITIVATPVEGGPPIFVRTSPDGAFEIKPVKPGKWKVSVYAKELPIDSECKGGLDHIIECSPGEIASVQFEVYPKKKRVKMLN